MYAHYFKLSDPFETNMIGKRIEEIVEELELGWEVETDNTDIIFLILRQVYFNSHTVLDHAG